MDDVLKLPATMDVARARALTDDLISRRGAPLSIDASGVERASALAIEVLISGARQWKADGHALDIHDMSAALSEIWTGLGLDPAECLSSPGTTGGDVGGAA